MEQLSSEIDRDYDSRISEMKKKDRDAQKVLEKAPDEINQLSRQKLNCAVVNDIVNQESEHFSVENDLEKPARQGGQEENLAAEEEEQK